MTLSSVDLGLPPWEIVAFLTSGIALNSFALSGKLLYHQVTFFHVSKVQI
jgi:MFS transporter, ACS family, solute carrier family 17 (sodium-dependent inorganic phosphate cotransporter), other